MTWILLATVGGFINAIVAFLDKHIVSDESIMPRPFVYAFYTCLLTGFWVLIFLAGLLPVLEEWGAPSLVDISKPDLPTIGMSFLSAYAFFIALLSMYEALRKENAVNVIPIIGAISALAAMGLGYAFLDAVLSPNFIWGIVVMALGTMLVAKSIPSRSVVLNLINSGVFFAVHYTAMKWLFNYIGFNDGFFWSRIGLMLFALSLLLIPVYFKKIRSQTKKTSSRAGMLVLVNKVLAGVAAFLVLKATDLGDVAVVQALDGLKFVFILVITEIFYRALPTTMARTSSNPVESARRVLYVSLITIGYFILFLGLK